MPYGAEPSHDKLEFDHGVAAGSEYDENKRLGISIDHYGEESGTPPAPVETPFGFLSRPLDPDAAPDGRPTIGCGLLWWWEGDRLNCMPIDDPRITELLPPVKKGGSLCYGVAFDPGAKPDGVSYALFDGVDPNGANRSGSYTVATRYGAKAHVFSMNVRKGGKEEISLLHGDGHGLVMGPDGMATLRNATGDAWMGTTEEGCVLAGSTKVQGSLIVGEAAASQEVVLLKPLMPLLQAIVTAIATTAFGPNPAPAAMLASMAAALPAKNFRTT